MLEKIFLVLALVVMVAFISAGCIQDGLIPCHIDPDIGTYTEGDMTVYTPYTSIWDAKRLQRLMSYKHLLNQEELKRLMEDDGYLYNFLDNDLYINMQSAEAIRDNLFSPDSPLALLLAGCPAFLLGYLGLSKPSDKRQIEALKNGKA